MIEKRLVELTEEESTGMMEFILSEKFDQRSSAEFLETLVALSKS